MDTVQRIKKELSQLIDDGLALALSLKPETRKQIEKKNGSPVKTANFKLDYAAWYTKAVTVVRDVLPHRLADFRALYQPEKRRTVDLETYGIATISGVSLWFTTTPLLCLQSCSCSSS